MSEPLSLPTPRQPALLLLGPTGSGKTPLGDWISRHGWQGRRCLHFDFGANLRDVVQRNQPDALVDRNDLEFLRKVLQSGALLEDKDFPLAARLLRWFLATHGADQRTWVVLNGLPRHVGQARAIESILDVRQVLYLDCPAETVLARIRTDTGGDRRGRVDDDVEAIHDKLRIFHERTAPLLDYYRQQGAVVASLPVTADMTPEAMGKAAASQFGDARQR